MSPGQERLALSSGQERIAFSPGRDRTAMSPGRERLALSPRRERVVLSPGRERLVVAQTLFSELLVSLIFASGKNPGKSGRPLFEKPISGLWDCGWRRR